MTITHHITMDIKTISILGCGWLGLPLALQLSQTHSVKKSPDFNIRIFEDQLIGDLDFFTCDLLIITIPFKRTFTDPFVYPKQIQQVLKHAHSWVIFTSSTSIYTDDISIVTENLVIKPQTPRQQALLETEHLIQSHGDYTILRLAGLYGPNRPIRPYNPDMNTPINLIHLDDVVLIIKKIIQYKTTGHIFNLVSDDHRHRSELHSHFKDQKQIGKIVSNHKLKTELDYLFKHPIATLDASPSHP
ncbi:MAG: hypothetical protein EXS67_05315 [Candidatus Margulisbacteria bacterium]|nr:hypothetical protein [Candidatus Margulisiibacteriota bacterium]